MQIIQKGDYMAQLRKDYLLDQWVIVAEKRGKRPYEFKTRAIESRGTDFFAPGNEHLTPPEITRYPIKGKWQIRVFPNKFGAVSNSKFSKITGSKLTKHMPAFGYHEVIAETPSSTTQLWDLSEQQIEQVLIMYTSRIEALHRKNHIQYVQIFKNHGKEAGTSLTHSHTQLVGLPQVPQRIRLIKKAIKKTKTTYQKIRNQEMKSQRKAITTKHFVSFCPFASKYNYELLVVPKQNYYRLADMPAPVIKDLARMMKKVLGKLRKNKWPYNYHVHYDPQGKNMLFHIEVTPRLATWAGFEHSTGMIINSVSPEDAAAFYRSR